MLFCLSFKKAFATAPFRAKLPYIPGGTVVNTLFLKYFLFFIYFSHQFLDIFCYVFSINFTKKNHVFLHTFYQHKIYTQNIYEKSLKKHPKNTQKTPSTAHRNAKNVFFHDFYVFKKATFSCFSTKIHYFFITFFRDTKNLTFFSDFFRVFLSFFIVHFQVFFSWNFTFFSEISKTPPKHDIVENPPKTPKTRFRAKIALRRFPVENPP